jgi:hypothetical protein
VTIPHYLTRPENPEKNRNRKEESAVIGCKEKSGKMHVNIKTVAEGEGISSRAANPMLREEGFEPHQVSKVRYSNEAEFEKKHKEGVGWSMNLVDNAIVLLVDERMRIPGFERM